MSARIVVSNWKYFHLYNVRAHNEFLANKRGVGVGLASQILFHPPLKKIDGSMLRLIEWAIFKA